MKRPDRFWLTVEVILKWLVWPLAYIGLLAQSIAQHGPLYADIIYVVAFGSIVGSNIYRFRKNWKRRWWR